MRTNTIYTDLKKLYESSPKEASLIVRLMLACNDIALANHCMSNFKTGQLRAIQQHIKEGAMLYFVRLQCGHLNEAMDLVGELNALLQESSLSANVFNKCSEETKEDFNKLRDCLDGFTRRQDFLKKVELMRHNTVFHYKANKLFESAVKIRSENSIGRYSSITRSYDVSCLRFNVADDIIDTVVCRFLWKLEGDDDLQKKADETSDFGSDLCKSFINFCSEFIFRYMQEHGTR
jgi:hypothetical protein